jgi:hypothetical protein
MSIPSLRSSQGAALAALSIMAGAAAPIVMMAAPAQAQANFSDTQGHWANDFITALAERDIIAGFPDGTFQPNAPVTRAQFAAIIRQAFDESRVRSYTGFSDVPSDFWATPAITRAFETGFVSGYPGNVFRPAQEIPKVQVLVALSSGLQLDPETTSSSTLSRFRDANAIPDYAISGVTAATERNMVVSYPNVNFLNPEATATRADVAAYIYQALVAQGELPALTSSSPSYAYVVRASDTTAGNGGTTQPPSNGNGAVTGMTVRSNSRIQTQFPGQANARFFITPNETLTTNLEVASAIRNQNNQVVIPANSQIQGRFQPVTVGGTPATQYVATAIVIDGRSYPVNAVSNPQVARPAEAQEVSSGTLEDGVATAAARILLGQVLGTGTNIEGLLGNILGGGQQTQQPAEDDLLIVIDPSTDLQLTLLSDFSVSR